MTARKPERRCDRCNGRVRGIRDPCVCHGLFLCDDDWDDVHLFTPDPATTGVPR